MIRELTRARVSFEDIRSMNHRAEIVNDAECKKRKFPIKVKIVFLFILVLASFTANFYANIFMSIKKEIDS